MTVNPISTYAIVQTTLNDVSGVEAKLQTEQEQLSSGNAAQSFSQMADQTQEFLSLNAVVSKTNQYQDNNSVISTYINTAATALGNIVSIGNSLQNLITQQATGVAQSGTSFSEQLKGMFQQIANQMNTQVNNQYLFSGTAITTPAVNAQNFPVLDQSGIPDKGYYTGNSNNLVAQPQDNTTVVYNVTGDAQGFQDVMAGLSMAQEGNDTNNVAMLQQAETFVQKGVQGIINLQATVNANKVEYTTIATNLTNSQLYFQGIQQTIGNTDLVSVSTKVATDQSILQAAFTVFAKMSQLTLADYLK